jgi:hypothetical protein
MATAEVYYNFDKTTITGLTPTSAKASIGLKQSEPPTTNIRYLDTNYCQQNVYICKDGNNYYCVVLNVDDIHAPTRFVYFAIKLKPSETKPSAGASLTDFDQLYSASSSSVSVTLNSYLKDGDKASVYTDKQSGYITILASSPITMTNQISASNVMQSTNITGLRFGGSDNAIIKKSILDWNIDCTLAGEDGEEVEVSSKSPDFVHDVMIFTILGIIMASTYAFIPVFYRSVIIPLKSLQSIDTYWSIISIVTLIMLLAYAIESKDNNWYFVFLSYLLIWISAKFSIKNNIGDISKTSGEGSIAGSDSNTVFTIIIMATMVGSIIIEGLGFTYKAIHDLTPSNRGIYFGMFIASGVLVAFAGLLSINWTKYSLVLLLISAILLILGPILATQIKT